MDSARGFAAATPPRGGLRRAGPDAADCARVAQLGLAAAVLYPGVGGSASRDLRPRSLPVGLKVYGHGTSAVMSVASISVLTASNYARDIHQRYLRPDMTPATMLRIGTLASLGAGGLGLLLAWKMRDIIDILQFGFTLNSAGLFLPTIAALWTDRVPASAAFWSTSASLVTVVAWRVAADAGAGGIFAIDPLWPGLAVSAVLIVILSLRRA
jgi:SSS family solute:Na+ symporter